jgi:hypothetical protein
MLSILTVILCVGLWFNKLVCGRWDVVVPLGFSSDNPLVKAQVSSLSFATYRSGKNFWASKPISRVLCPD